MTPGDHVRILRPDKPEHATGIVSDPLGPSWPLWVRHECDCWQAGTWQGHTRGYDLSEVYREPATCPTCGLEANPGPPVWCQRCDEPAAS
jgi:hypothetical protein